MIFPRVSSKGLQWPQALPPLLGEGGGGAGVGADQDVHAVSGDQRRVRGPRHRRVAPVVAAHQVHQRRGLCVAQGEQAESVGDCKHQVSAPHLTLPIVTAPDVVPTLSTAKPAM